MEFLHALKDLLFFSPFSSRHALLLWCAFIAVVLAFLYLLTRRAHLGKAISLLRENGCTDENSAQSAAALTSQRSVRRALQSRDRLIASCTDKTGETRYYLPADRLEKAAYFEKASAFSAGKAVLYLLLFYVAILAFYHLWPIIERIWN